MTAVCVEPADVMLAGVIEQAIADARSAREARQNLYAMAERFLRQCYAAADELKAEEAAALALARDSREARAESLVFSRQLDASRRLGSSRRHGR